jgi:hypothetical protein
MNHLSELIQQRKDERVELLLRRHWITFVPIVVLFLVLALIPFVVYFLVETSVAIKQDPLLYPTAILSGGAYYLFLLVFFFAQFLDYHLDMWIVTNHRLIDIHQKGLFSRVVTELHLSLIQDITSETHGFFAHIFNYGTVHIHSSGPKQKVEFLDVPAPHNVRNALIQLTSEDKRVHGSEMS